MGLMFLFHTLTSRSLICQLYINKAGESRRGDDQRGHVGTMVPRLDLFSRLFHSWVLTQVIAPLSLTALAKHAQGVHVHVRAWETE